MTKTTPIKKNKKDWKCEPGRCTCVRDQEKAERIQRTPLYQKLETYRRQQAKKDGNTWPHSVLQHKTMMEIVMKEPRTEKELQSVFGIGPKKTKRYGSNIVCLVEILA